MAETSKEKSRTNQLAAKAREHAFEEVGPAGAPRDHLAIDDLRNVLLQITVELGQRTMLVRELLELKKGSVIALDKLAGEMTDVYVNGLFLARGEVVVIGDRLHVRIAEIVGEEDQKA